MILDRPLFGILLMLLFCLLAPLGDALAKLLGQSVPLTQLIFVRFAVQAALLIPLVDTIAIVFVMPFILLLLGNIFLQEVVGRHRLIACLVGFAGTLLIIQPSFENVGTPALLPLLAAWLIAFFMMVTRKIAKVADPIGLQVANGIMAVLMLAPAPWFFGAANLQKCKSLRLATINSDYCCCLG